MDFNDSTTSQLPLVPAFAPIGRRLLALIIDGLITLIFGLILGHVIPVLGGLLVWFFYGPVFESSQIRATVGKHLLGIQVSDLAGRRISFKAALIRNAMKIVSGMLACFGFLVALFTEKKQALHDLLADTIVVYGRNEKPIVDAWVEQTKAIFNSGSQTSGHDSGHGSGHASSQNTDGIFTPTSSPGSSSTPSWSPAPPPRAQAETVVEQLERLQALRSQGSLSEIEFEAAKKKILEG